MRHSTIRHRFADHSGVYSFVNLATGRIYVGSTARAFRRRWIQHLNELKNGIHACAPLQVDWDTGAPDDFAFDVIELTRNINARIREQFHIDRLRDEGAELYNQQAAYNPILPPASDDDVAAMLDRLAPDPL